MQQLLKIETNINPILKVAKIRIPNALDEIDTLIVLALLLISAV